VAVLSRQYVPRGALSACVKCFWYWEGAPQTHAQERLMPNGEASLVFNLRDEPIRIYEDDACGGFRSCGRAVISGARTRSFVIDSAQQDRVFGIQFAPGGAFPFFRAPVSEMENLSVDLDDLWPGVATELRERLLAAETIDAMFLLTERYLIAQIVKPLELHPAVCFAREQLSRRSHLVRVATVMDGIGMSQRRFIQLFHEQVGLTPKAFSRVRRFQRILETIPRANDVNWIDLALGCGYYDQAHFIHDFREFSGLTPTQYLARATEHLNHVPI
jgi:AraC-like DNA-binding protein